MAIYLNEVPKNQDSLFLFREIALRLPRDTKQMTRNKGFKVIWSLYGSMHLHIDSGEQFLLQPGEVVILPKSCMQTLWRTSSPSSQSSLHFLVLHIRDILTEEPPWVKTLKEKANQVCKIDIRENLKFWQWYCQYRQYYDHSGTQQTDPQNFFEELVSILLELLAPATKTSQINPKSKWMSSLLKHYFYNLKAIPTEIPFPQEWSASHSETETDQDISEFIQTLKIERSKLLIFNHNIPTSRLATDSGFGSTSTYYREFQDHTGMTLRTFKWFVAQKMKYNRQLSSLHKSGEETSNRDFQNQMRLAQVKEYIYKNLKSPITLGDIAWTVNWSEEHLSRVFHQAMGVRVMEYVKIRRLAYVKELLTSDSDHASLETIAEQSGFGSASLLCRTFKKSEGMTPREFQKQLADRF